MGTICPPPHHFPAYPTAVINMWNGPCDRTPVKRWQCLTCGYSSTRKDNMERHLQTSCDKHKHADVEDTKSTLDFDKTDVTLTVADLVSIPASLVQAVAAVGIVDVVVMNMHFSGHPANRNIFTAYKGKAFVLHDGRRTERKLQHVVQAVLRNITSLLQDKTIRRYVLADVPSDAAARIAELLVSRTPRPRPAYIPAPPADVPVDNEVDMQEYFHTYSMYKQVEVLKAPFLELSIEFKITEIDNTWYRHWWVWRPEKNKRQAMWVYYGETETVECVLQKVVESVLRSVSSGLIPGLHEKVIEWYEGKSWDRSAKSKDYKVLDRSVV